MSRTDGVLRSTGMSDYYAYILDRIATQQVDERVRDGERRRAVRPLRRRRTRRRLATTLHQLADRLDI